MRESLMSWSFFRLCCYERSRERTEDCTMYTIVVRLCCCGTGGRGLKVVGYAYATFVFVAIGEDAGWRMV